NLDFSPLLATMADYPDAVHHANLAAALFHATLVAGLAAWMEQAGKQHGISRLALGGGCFHNAILRNGLIRRLASASFNVFSGQQVSPDDSAIALGQAWVALQHMQV
ncbi:MAG: carbamoyltransferase HypF, partial [Betaproteobacteria bacterium]|nr:carbamoyltransferase HypF [Betaproteobacteria bacterium]